MLKIKEGAKIYPYGTGGNAFTSESALSQPILEHLKGRFPEDITDSEAVKMTFPATEKKVKNLKSK